MLVWYREVVAQIVYLAKESVFFTFLLSSNFKNGLWNVQLASRLACLRAPDRTCCWSSLGPTIWPRWNSQNLRLTLTKPKSRLVELQVCLDKKPRTQPRIVKVSVRIACWNPLSDFAKWKPMFLLLGLVSCWYRTEQKRMSSSETYIHVTRSAGSKPVFSHLLGFGVQSDMLKNRQNFGIAPRL